jgi:hypothetical protein
MTESDWLACDSSEELLEHVCDQRRQALGITDTESVSQHAWDSFPPARVYPRKRRLFAVACCRRIWHLLPDEARHAVEVAERYADGVAAENERVVALAAVESAGKVHVQCPTREDDLWRSKRQALKAAGAALWAFSDEAFTRETLIVDFGNLPFLATDDDDGGFIATAWQAHNAWIYAQQDPEVLPLLERFRFLLYPRLVAEAGDPVKGTAWYSEVIAQCNLVRDLFGNPFRPVSLDTTWQSATVMSIAAALYDERDFDRMPILADALEDVGCTNTDILNHCRQPGVHARGCWVVDAILGKDRDPQAPSRPGASGMFLSAWRWAARRVSRRSHR